MRTKNAEAGKKELKKESRKNIQEWLGGKGKDYAEVQKAFLKIPLYDYCRYLETLLRNGEAQKTYEEILIYTDAKRDTDMNHVLRLLCGTLSANASNYTAGSAEATRYDWAQQAIYDLLVMPFFHQPGARETDRWKIQEKVMKYNKNHKKQ